MNTIVRGGMKAQYNTYPSEEGINKTLNLMLDDQELMRIYEIHNVLNNGYCLSKIRGDKTAAKKIKRALVRYEGMFLERLEKLDKTV